MAIYHCSTKTINRSSGRTAVASSAYRSGEKLVDERTGLTHIALGRAIATADSNPKVKAVLNRTEKLMGRVTKLVSADPQLTQKFAPALAIVTGKQIGRAHV